MVPVRSDEIRHLAQQIDYASSTRTYYGYAPAGQSPVNGTRWRIARETYDGSGRSISIDFPNGSADFEFSWALRASYTYS